MLWTLRGYRSQLRKLRRLTPGPVDGSPCVGTLFTENTTGPFSTYSEMTAWFNHKLDVSQRFNKAPPDAPRFDNSWPLVFTHNDLNMRNVLLAPDGKLYMIDWAWSGFYPEYGKLRISPGSGIVAFLSWLVSKISLTHSNDPKTTSRCL